MTPNEKKFVEDLKKNGKRMTWAKYAEKYFPDRGEKWVRDFISRMKIIVKLPKKEIIRPTIVLDKSQPSPTPQEQDLLARAKKEGKWGSWGQMTQECNPGCADPEWSKRVFEKNNFRVKERPPSPLTHIEDVRRTNEVIALNAQNKSLANDLIDLKQRLAAFERADQYTPKVFDIDPPRKGRENEATAVVQFSDFHVGERVKKSVTNGLNEYNTGIAKQRAATLFQNTLKVTDIQRAGTKIDELVLHLGGDFITGYIHPELEQENELSPPEEMEFSLDLLTTGIEYLLEHGKFKTIRCICNRGNHARLTKKMQGNDYRQSWERTLYFSLAKAFQKNENVIIRADDAELSYMNVYGYKLRFAHGQQISYLGGIGGFNVPLARMLKEWDETEKADYNFFCHHHTYCQPNPRTTVNGSLIGFGSRALGKGYTFQRPIQSFTLIDSHRGVTVKAPIFCD